MNTKTLTASAQYNLHLGDNLATLKNYPDDTFDSIVTDPPYGIDFLGKEWDSHTGTVELYKECLRVLKPGGYLLAFSAARTYHKLAYSVELAGFEIRDQLMWLYSSGFPKAQDIGKAIQKRLGVEESITTEMKHQGGIQQVKYEEGIDYQRENINMTQPVCTSPLAKEWEGFKTALKPAHEPIVMARKPYKGSTIDNVLKNGLGAMNIDATRVEWDSDPVTSTTIGTKATFTNFSAENLDKDKTMDEQWIGNSIGRYPSNVIGEVAEGYQKYFYCPKVSRKERHSGFEIPPALTGHIKGCYAEDGSRMAVGMDAAEGYRGNNHPTVKPVALMEYLIKLVTPPSTPTLQRKVLDPFNGSGSTGMAATKLGHHYTGCDLDEKYIAISKTRIDLFGDVE